MNRVLKITILFFCTSFLMQNAFAQKRKTVGVVLSGGGAKGLAHIGALKVLEEAGIQIDYISGTSMGAIIGGLYASGWSANQLDSIIKVTDFDALMRDELPRDVKPFFEKEYGEKYALSLSVKDFKIQLPSALSNGQNGLNFFSRLTYQSAHITDFSKLKIPFVCFGTDAETGEEVIFEKGNLARAIRASGSFPGLLTPFKIDGRLITDGGVVNNFPVKILKDKGIDFIIGVNVEDVLYKGDDLYSIDKILEQVSSFQMSQNSKAQLDFCDILMYPDYEGYGVTSFDAAEKLILAGENEARKFIRELNAVVKGQQISDNRYEVNRRPNTDTIDVEDLIIYHTDALSQINILEFFPKGLEGRIAEKDFFDGITNLYGTGIFRYIDYYFTKKENGKYELTIQPVEKQGYDKLLRVGLHYDDVYKSSLLLNLTLKNAGIKNSTFSGNLIISDRFRYSVNYLIDYGNKPDIGINSSLELNFVPTELPVLLEGDSVFRNVEIDLDYLDFSNEIYFRLFSTNYQSLGLSAQAKFFSTRNDLEIIQNENKFISEEGLYFTGSFYHKYDSRNNRNFPKRGIVSNLNFRYINPLTSEIEAETGFNLDWTFTKVTPITGNFSIGVSTDIGWTLAETPTPPYLYFLGGNNRNFINNFKPFEGLAFAEKFGANLARLSVYGQLRPMKKQYLTLGTNIALLGETPEDLIDSRAIQSLSLGYGIDTPLGPIGLTYALSNEGRQWYFNLGYWF